MINGNNVRRKAKKIQSLLSDGIRNIGKRNIEKGGRKTLVKLCAFFVSFVV
jgi:hypothetical protein